MDAVDLSKFLHVLLGTLLGSIGVGLWLHLGQRERRRQIRRDAIHQSRATLKGQLVEQLVPVLPDFPFDAADARFLGAPIDYVVFDGYTEGGNIEIVLVEVKTGNAQLSKGERRIREAVRHGRIRFETIRLAD